jgi:hypothetical protein
MDCDFRKGAKFREHTVPQRMRDTLTRIAELWHETVPWQANGNLWRTDNFECAFFDAGHGPCRGFSIAWHS